LRNSSARRRAAGAAAFVLAAEPASRNAARLEGALLRALDWAEAAVNHFADSAPEDPATAKPGFHRQKVVGEAALLLLAASRCRGRPAVVAQAARIARRLVPLARSESVAVRVCLEPGLALEHALAHLCLSRMGFADARFDANLRAALASGLAEGVERSPYRRLEQRWLLNAMGEGRHGAVPAATSALSRPPDLLSLLKDDLYALTHTIMYATDLGAGSVRCPRGRAAVLSETECALAACLDEPDYDLAGELALITPCLNARWTPAVDFALEVLLDVEAQHGFLPAPGVAVDAGATGGEDRQALLEKHYHSTFVMGLLTATTLAQGHGVGPGVTVEPGAAAALLPLLDTGAEPRWRALFLAKPSAARDELAGFVFAVILRQAMLARDFVRIRSALTTVLQFGLAASPSARQAAGVLHRVAAYDRAMGPLRV
jgi:hypothetical protein